MAALFESDRSWRFAMSAHELWAVVVDVGRYRDWWPWLRAFDPGDGLVEGAAWQCVVQPPLAFPVRFTVVLDRVHQGCGADAVVTGDVQGWARLALMPDMGDGGGDGACVARMVSALGPAQGVLAGLARFARPLARRGHDWVLETGERQFVRHALPLDNP